MAVLTKSPVNTTSNTSKYFDHLRKIRERYSQIPYFVNEAGFRLSPYDIYDWSLVFTPIEDNVWRDIRYLCLPMYPQFPVGKYWIDFADPHKKIGIEADGKMHNERREKDRDRDADLRRLGWRIFRIPGRHTFRCNHCVDTGILSEGAHMVRAEMGYDEYHEGTPYCFCSAGVLREISIELYD